MSSNSFSSSGVMPRASACRRTSSLSVCPRRCHSHPEGFHPVGVERLPPAVRKLALQLPEAHEVQAWGEPTFRVKNKIFAMYAHANTHHGSGRNAVWCKAGPVNQQLMVNAAPEFTEHPKVINGCSDLFVEVFGERGRHARSAVGMSSLPGGIPVEIEVIVAIS